MQVAHTAAIGDRLRAAHRFLADWSFYALALCSALAYALLAVRMYRTLSWSHAWLAWNLVLAWVPYLLGLWAATIALRRPGQPWRLLLTGALWLGFLPNAPYLVTDFMHVGLHQSETWLFWYDLVLLATFAWTGCVLGVTSLRVMQGLVAAYAGRLPYELLLAPVDHPHGTAFTSDLLPNVLELLGDAVRRLHAVEGPVPLNAWLHDGEHWHVEILPRLSVLAGLELGAGLYVNTLAPEDAAERLRDA